MKKLLFIPVYILTVVTIISGCKKDDGIVTPGNLSIDPGEALPGAFITIKGNELQDIVSIRFGDVAASFSPVFNTSSAIFTEVPDNAGFGAQKVTLTNRSGQSAQVDFIVKQPFPVISGFSPASGPVGDTVTITGTSLQRILSVMIGNVAARVVDSASANSIKIKIPEGATSGLITITTGGGSSVSGSVLSVGERAILIADFDGAGLIPNGDSWYMGGDLASRNIVNSVPAPFSGNYLKAIPKTTSSSGYAGFETYDITGGTANFGLTSPASDTYLKFEANNNGKTATVLQVVISEGTENYAQNVNIDGNGWNTISIRLADMHSNYGGGTLIPNPATIKKVKFFFQGYADAEMEINIDNVRFAY